jgi:O-acetyl-ADP-ribose deacetylase (regulator of RNase III)
MFRIHFISLNNAWIQEIQTLFANIQNIQITHGNIEKYREKDTDVFVSPCNSLGQMSGGIDYSLSRKMFPTCETIVRNRIKKLSTKTILGRSYLDIGSALFIQLKYYDVGLIIAPTMFTPEDVSTTKNAYISFLAALMMMNKYTQTDSNKYTLIATSHCCGFGCMDPIVSAQQMYDAYMDFSNGVVHEHPDSADISDFIKIAL